jgi:Superinfection immunity protein
VTTHRRPTAGWLIAGLVMLGIVVWLGTLPAVPAGLIACGLLLYFLPWFVAWNRNHTNLLAIFVLNFFVGWTFIGWVVALVWACSAIRD